jgi:hypothetical protein
LGAVGCEDWGDKAEGSSVDTADLGVEDGVLEGLSEGFQVG